jgi:hypothetical protein
MMGTHWEQEKKTKKILSPLPKKKKILDPMHVSE